MSAGVHDGHFTTGEVFLKMLKDERRDAKDLVHMAYGSSQQLGGSLDFILPSEQMVKQRNEVVENLIFRTGSALR